MVKSCGNCFYFLKIKHWAGRFGGCGLCEYYDARTNSDYGKNCKHHKNLKYNRKKAFVVELVDR